MNASGRIGRRGRPSQGTNWFKRLVSCLFGCVSPAEHSATEEVDISTRVHSWTDVSVSSNSTDGNLPPKRHMSPGRAGDTRNGTMSGDSHQPLLNAEDPLRASANLVPVCSADADEVEVDITAGMWVLKTMVTALINKSLRWSWLVQMVRVAQPSWMRTWSLERVTNWWSIVQKFLAQKRLTRLPEGYRGSWKRCGS